MYAAYLLLVLGHLVPLRSFHPSKLGHRVPDCQLILLGDMQTFRGYGPMCPLANLFLAYGPIEIRLGLLEIYVSRAIYHFLLDLLADIVDCCCPGSFRIHIVPRRSLGQSVIGRIFCRTHC